MTWLCDGKLVTLKEKEEVPADLNIPDNYVAYTLRNAKPRPPLSLSNLLGELQWVSVIVLTATPTIAFIGSRYADLKWQTAIFAVLYYFFTGLGITAGKLTFSFSRPGLSLTARVRSLIL